MINDNENNIGSINDNNNNNNENKRVTISNNTKNNKQKSDTKINKIVTKQFSITQIRKNKPFQ